MEDNLKKIQMEDDLIFFHMEDNLYFFQMEDILNFLVNKRRPQYFGKWKTTSIFWQMEDDINGRQTHWKTTSIGKTGLASPSLS
jgi:hypothetical protein